MFVHLPLPGLEQYLPKLQAVLFDLNSIADDDPILNNPEGTKELNFQKFLCELLCLGEKTE